MKVAFIVTELIAVDLINVNLREVMQELAGVEVKEQQVEFIKPEPEQNLDGNQTDGITHE